MVKPRKRTKRKIVRLASSIDVARRAGVSQSAVSRAFAAGRSISDETKQKVLKAAEELGYRPNALAKAVLSRQSDLIGIVMGEFADPFFAEILELLLTNLERSGHRALIKRVQPGDTADSAVEEVLRYRVRGAIVTSSIITDDTAQKCGRSSVPVVLFNRHVKDLGVTSVCSDNVEGGRKVADLLLDSGHSRPAFVSGPEESTNRDRKRGFVNRLSERGIRFVPVEGGASSHAVGYGVTKQLLNSLPRPDALFCSSDILAFGALDAVRESGLRIADDVSVVGFDDVPMAGWPVFNLTTVRQKRDEMVREAVEALLSQIDFGTAPSVRLLPAELIIRGTVRNSKN
jgi:DNA-binding LacI/PurR family transcriptional regulator